MSADSCKVFFVVGRGRSGTTLLGRMLGAHPAIEVAPEGFFVMNLRARYARGPWDTARIDRFCEDLVLERRMGTWGLELEAIGEELRARVETLTFREACLVVYNSYATLTRRQPEVRLVGDKNPHYALFTGTLAELFPEARFIHIVRDPRDNVLSYRKVPFDVSGTAALAYRWRRYNEELLAVARRHPDRFVRLSYESLLRAPEDVLGMVCEFLGQSFDPAMLAFGDDGGPDGFYGAESPWFQKLAGPLDAGQARKWESEMSADDIATVESVCGPTLEELGYDRTGRGHPDPARFLGALLGWGTVVGEKTVFGVLPAEWRIRAINAHRARTGRV